MDLLAVIVVPVVILGTWLGAGALIRRGAGFTRDPALAERRREASDESRWTSGRIGIVSLNNCVKLYRLPDGFLLRLMPIFGGGYRWIPDAGILERREQASTWYAPRRVELVTRSGTILLCATAAELVGRHPLGGTAVPGRAR